jgi:hypothetical protein
MHNLTYVMDIHYQEGVAVEGLALHFSTDFVGVCFRENPDFMRLAARCQYIRTT